MINIERPGVDDFARSYDPRIRGLSSQFVWTNRSKESVALDLKHPAASEVLRRLLGKTDVLLCGSSPCYSALNSESWQS